MIGTAFGILLAFFAACLLVLAGYAGRDGQGVPALRLALIATLLGAAGAWSAGVLG